MKQTNKLKKMMLWVVLMLPMLLVLKPEGANATHFRYGHLTWQRLSPTGNNVRFTLVNAFRRADIRYPGTFGDGFVAVGDIIQEDIGSTVLFFGDGNSTSVLDYKVISIDVTNDWFLAQALEPGNTTKTTIDYTYPSSTNAGSPWIAEIFSCCRTGVELNNAGGYYHVSTLVETASGNRSPVSSLPAIVNLPYTAIATFLVPGADSDPNTQLTWRLASSSEAGNGFFNQPTGLTIDPATGLVTWNTLANAVLGGLYSCQVIIEDRDAITGALRTQVAVDFLIYITTQSTPCDVNLPPYFVAGTTAPGLSACGLTYTVNEGQHLSFVTTAADPDAGNVVTLNSGGGPSGSTFTPNLPTTGNPVSSTFDWTPGAGTAGSYIVTFTATDSCGLQALCSSTINVLANPCNLRISCSLVNPTCWNSCDGSITDNITGGSGHYGYLWNTGATTKNLTNLCAGTYTLTVTDSVTQCTKVKTTILKKAKVGARFNVINATCGLCNGSITATGTGGNGGPYTYLWSTAATTATINNVCANVNYTVTVTDKKGCTYTCKRKITNSNINCCNISVSAGQDEHSHFGYAAEQTVVHTAIVTGGTGPYTYVWTLNRPLLCNQGPLNDGNETFNGGACTNNSCPAVAAPSCTTSTGGVTVELMAAGTVCVSVTDNNGCTATDCFDITAEDVRCYAGNSGNVKVLVCHHTSSTTNPFNQLCVDNNAVPAHLAHDPLDFVGICASPRLESGASSNDFNMTLYPNPAIDMVNIKFMAELSSTYQLSVFDLSGRVVATSAGTVNEGANQIALPLNKIAAGVYSVRINAGDKTSLMPLIISE